MTDEEKAGIERLRRMGKSYGEVAAELKLSINSVKTFCKRNGLGKDMELKEPESVCEQCGVQIEQKPGRKRKRFCSDHCRNLWWSKHMQLVKRKANYECTCQFCGKTFISYGNKGRKYCDQTCYRADRWG